MLLQSYFGRDSSKLDSEQTPVRGVNLGGWLVVEKWITPSLFKGLNAKDEYHLSRNASPAIRTSIRKHRDTFITKEDFEWLAGHGFDAVRLPVGSWVFGDEPPYEGALEYVDKAFEWADEFGLKILIDLHGAPGSQNGWDHSGRAGSIRWHRKQANIIKTLQVIAKLAQRYGKRPELLGIGLLNEPHHKVPRRTLRRFYEAAYRIIRDECGSAVWVVIHDNFRPRRWRHVLSGSRYSNVYIDTHQYQCFSKKDKQLGLTGHMNKTLRTVPRQLAKMRRHHGVIIGEWSLALDPLSFFWLHDGQAIAGLRAYGAAQTIAFHTADAWFYWTYRTEDGGPWSLRDSIDRGLLTGPGKAADYLRKSSQKPEN